VRYKTIITEIIFILVRVFEARMYGTVFELIRKSASRERQIYNVDDTGKYRM